MYKYKNWRASSPKRKWVGQGMFLQGALHWEGGSNVKQSLIYEIKKQKQVEIKNVDDSFFCEVTAPRHHSLPQ